MIYLLGIKFAAVQELSGLWWTVMVLKVGDKRRADLTLPFTIYIFWCPIDFYQIKQITVPTVVGYCPIAL